MDQILAIFQSFIIFTAALRSLAGPGLQKKVAKAKKEASYDRKEGAKYNTAALSSEDANFAGSLLWEPTGSLLTEYTRRGDAMVAMVIPCRTVEHLQGKIPKKEKNWV